MTEQNVNEDKTVDLNNANEDAVKVEVSNEVEVKVDS